MRDMVLHLLENSTPVTESGCWIWLRSQDSGGYGTVRFDGKNRKSHRLSWLLFRGEIPEGIKVCHKCDTPLCINPDHLFLGTQEENIRDMVAKHRQRSGGEGRFGQNHPAHKLNIDQVTKIREMGRLKISQYVIADEFGVSVMTINRIIRGISWRGV